MESPQRLIRQTLPFEAMKIESDLIGDYEAVKLLHLTNKAMNCLKVGNAAFIKSDYMLEILPVSASTFDMMIYQK